MSVLVMKVAGLALADAIDRRSKAKGSAQFAKAQRDREAAIRILVNRPAESEQALAAKVAALRMDFGREFDDLCISRAGELLKRHDRCGELHPSRRARLGK